MIDNAFNPTQSDAPPMEAAPQSESTPRLTPGYNPKGAKPVSLRDVAKLANVSVATVSMVLNENPRISRATHLRVQQVISRMGYRPNRLAQSLSSRYTRALAILLPALRHGFGDAYFGELISGIADRAGKLGYKVMLEQAKPDFLKTKEHIAIFERRFVDGILFLGCNDRHHFLADFADRRFPLIVVDNDIEEWKLDHVVCNYRAGAEQVMNYLLQLGHRHIGLIHGATAVKTSRDVMQAYDRKLRSVEIEPNQSLREDGRFTEEGGASAARSLLSRHPNLTAIFAGNDKMALGALHYLHQQGIEVPQQISVVGFDDLQQSAYIQPALTTVHLPLYEVGSMACERLIERIHGRVDRVAEVLPTHLVLRESTAMVRSESVIAVPAAVS